MATRPLSRVPKPINAGAIALAALLLAAAPAGAAIVTEQSAQGGSNASPFSVGPVDGGTNQTYVLLISVLDDDAVTAVSGGGQTWTLQETQCADGSATNTICYTGQGPPSGSFSVSITHSGGRCAAVLVRYSGVGTIEDATGENINGEAGGCGGATPTGQALLELTSSTAGSVHVVGAATGGETVSSAPVEYTYVNSATTGGGPSTTTVTVYDASYNGTLQFDGTLGAAAAWATAGVVLVPGVPAPPEPATVNYRSIGSGGTVATGTNEASITAGASTVAFAAALSPEVGPGDILAINGGGNPPAGITMAQSVENGAKTSPITLPSIDGGTNQTYLLFIGIQYGADVTGVTDSGSGLTWTERFPQENDYDNGLAFFTAQGSPGSAFTVDVAFDDSSANTWTGAVLLRYEGVDMSDGFEDAHAKQIGPSTQTADLTLTSTVDEAMHVIAVAPNHTSITSVTAAYDPKIIHAQYGSGTKYGHVDLFELELDSTTDTLTATLDGSVDWLTGGVVLKPDLSPGAGSTLNIVSRDSDTQVTVAETAWQTHTNQSYTIDRAYVTIEAWEDAVDGDLVGEDRREVGVCYADSDFTPASTITIDDSTTDFSHYMTLTAAEGQRHDGTAGSGVVVDFGGASADGIDVRDEYTVLEWLEVSNYRGSFSDGLRLGADGALVQNMLIRDLADAETRGILVMNDATIRNTIIEHDGMDGISVQGTSNVTIENVTIYAWSGPANQDGIDCNVGTTVTIRNTICVGNASSDIDVDGTFAYFGNNMYETFTGTDPESAPGSNNTTTVPVPITDLFLSVTDLHLQPSGHDAGGGGLDLSASFLTDVDNQTRTVPWDMGADEVSLGSAKPTIVRWYEVAP